MLSVSLVVFYGKDFEPVKRPSLYGNLGYGIDTTVFRALNRQLQNRVSFRNLSTLLFSFARIYSCSSMVRSFLPSFLRIYSWKNEFMPSVVSIFYCPVSVISVVSVSRKVVSVPGFRVADVGRVAVHCGSDVSSSFMSIRVLHGQRSAIAVVLFPVSPVGPVLEWVFFVCVWRG